MAQSEKLNMDTLNLINQKREELRRFFKDAKCSEDMITKVIENEIKHLTENEQDLEERPYIAASNTQNLQSEYEVMTGQPFTEIEDNLQPLTEEEIKKKIKDNPIIIQKASEIQILVSKNKSQKNQFVPFEELNLKEIEEINEDKDAAQGNEQALQSLSYSNMRDLVKTLDNSNTKKRQNVTVLRESPEHISDDSDEYEFELIEKTMTQLTNKSYETRFRETQSMLTNLADKYDSITLNTENVNDLVRESNSFDPPKTEGFNTKFLACKNENNTFRQALPVMDSVSQCSDSTIESCDANKSQVTNVKGKLLDTEYTLKNISAILDRGYKNQTENNLQPCKGRGLKNISLNSYEENIENSNTEFEEMKSFAKNIANSAEELSDFITHDITNKRNSLTELLKEVNLALETSKKSNLIYQKLKEKKLARNISDTESFTHEATPSNESDLDSEIKGDREIIKREIIYDSQIDNIHEEILALNEELKDHQHKVDESKLVYQNKSEECKHFISEIDEILTTSRKVLHPENKLDTYCNQASSTGKPTGKMCLQNDLDVELDDTKTIIMRSINDKDQLVKNKSKSDEAKTTTLEEISCYSEIPPNVVNDSEKNIIEESAKIPKKINESSEIVFTEYESKDHMGGILKEGPNFKDPKPTSLYEKMMDVSEAKEICKDRIVSKSIVSTYPSGKQAPNVGVFVEAHYISDTVGFSKIENLEEYTGLKCIFLENNGIERIEGLDNLSQLKCLYMHYNLIRKIENLEGCPQLDTLNLDHNFISKIEGLGAVPDLHTLSLAHNMVTAVGLSVSISHLSRDSQSFESI
ncbi:Dynein assembly factor 1, axonemal homolog [Eumeta japonica]|uniref:Dynein axonemal assembly factor 1 homolog n=1 Tax=Eumeta variegata TaxID=151549 RepID=A0A4C1ZPI2_EUMVA|nr:Dynein assembly factor 1, axonemal homolog [Eumeta japonica]